MLLRACLVWTLLFCGVSNAQIVTDVVNQSVAPGIITLTNTHLLVGNASNVAADVAMSGDATMANTGAITVTGGSHLTGTLGSGLTAPSFTVTTAFTATGLVTLPALATQATNTVVGNATSGTASPTALAVGTCSTASSALIWTTNTGFGCNTSITANAVPAANLTGTTLASGVTASSLTSFGAAPVLGAATFTSLVSTATGAVKIGESAGNGILNLNGGAIAGTDYNFLSTATLLIVNRATGGDIEFREHNGTAQMKIAATTGAVSMTGTLSVAGMTNVATTSAVCFNTGTFLLTYDGTLGTCTVSGEQYKLKGEALPSGALANLVSLRTESWTYNQTTSTPGVLDARVHVGLYAQDVEKLDKRCVGYDKKTGAVQNYDDRCVLAYTIAALREKVANDNARFAAIESKVGIK